MSTAWRGAPENGGGVELRDSWGVEHQPKNLLCAPGALVQREGAARLTRS